MPKTKEAPLKKAVSRRFNPRHGVWQEQLECGHIVFSEGDEHTVKQRRCYQCFFGMPVGAEQR